MSRNHQHRRNDLAPVQFQFDRFVLLHAELAHRVETHQRGVVPGHVRYLLGQLLQPADVRIAPVIERRVRKEFDLQRPVARRCRCIRCRRDSLGRRKSPRREGCILHPSIVQRLLPSLGEVALDVCLRIRHNGVIRRTRRIKQRLQDVMRRLAAIKRVDHRLHNRDRPIGCAGIGPALEVMGLIDMPVRAETRLVQVHAKVHRVRHRVEA